MLEKFVIHAKNIVFLKLLTYFLLIGLLISLLIFYDKQYRKSLAKNQKIATYVAATEAKLLLINKQKKQISDNLQLYAGTSNVSKKQLCNEKIKLIKNIEDLGTQLNLNRPISSTFRQIYSTNEGKVALQFKVKYYELSIEFAVPSFNVLQEILESIHTLLPQDSVIFSLNIKVNDFLDPALILALKEQASPDFLKVQLGIKIRELYKA